MWRGQKTWNGVAILSRKAEPVLIRNALPGDRNDHEARYIEAAISGIIVACLYLPNGNPQPGPKFDYKLAWFSAAEASTRQNSSSRTCLSCSPATTTSRRRRSISIRPNHGTRMR